MQKHWFCISKIEKCLSMHDFWSTMSHQLTFWSSTSKLNVCLLGVVFELITFLSSLIRNSWKKERFLLKPRMVWKNFIFRFICLPLKTPKSSFLLKFSFFRLEPFFIFFNRFCSTRKEAFFRRFRFQRFFLFLNSLRFFSFQHFLTIQRIQHFQNLSPAYYFEHW